MPPSLPLPFCTQVDFEVTIPGEGKDRIFKVSIKWMAIVSWRMLHEALVSGQIPVPLESVQALDVAMRHLASMRYRRQGPCCEHCACRGGTGCPRPAVGLGRAWEVPGRRRPCLPCCVVQSLRMLLQKKSTG